MPCSRPHLRIASHGSPQSSCADSTALVAPTIQTRRCNHPACLLGWSQLTAVVLQAIVRLPGLAASLSEVAAAGATVKPLVGLLLFQLLGGLSSTKATLQQLLLEFVQQVPLGEAAILLMHRVHHWLLLRALLPGSCLLQLLDKGVLPFECCPLRQCTLQIAQLHDLQQLCEVSQLERSHVVHALQAPALPSRWQRMCCASCHSRQELMRFVAPRS